MAAQSNWVRWGGFFAGMGLAMASLAAGYNGFDVQDALIDSAQIHQGGPPRDGIPAIDTPQFINADAADFLHPDSRVLGVSLNGESKAYPISILNWHEVVNDQFGQQPVVVTYCPLCGTGVAYRAVVEGKRLNFGVSGLLYNSDVLLYDRETESLWSQLMNQAVSGPNKGKRLQMLPAELTTWERWQSAHPDSRVLSTDTGYRRNYSRNPYGGYDESMAVYFPVAFLSRQYHPKERVLGVRFDGVEKAYPFAELSRSGEQGVIEDQVGDRRLRIQYDATTRSGVVFDDKGSPVPVVNAFWFAWFAFFPDTEVYLGDGDQ